MDLAELLPRPTGKTLELERDLFSTANVPRPIAAFANTSGGTVLIGVEDGTRAVRDVSERPAMRGRSDAPIGESGVEMDGPRIAFAAPLRNLGTGDPASATVSMADPEPSVRGRPVPGAVWDANRARSMGLILSDGRDAPFRLVVRRIEVCRRGIGPC